LELIKPVVYSNCIHSILAILRAMFHLQIEYADPDRVVCLLAKTLPCFLTRTFSLFKGSHFRILFVWQKSDLTSTIYVL
jgi:hypothetical protein